jgi:hypothetical protein
VRGLEDVAYHIPHFTARRRALCRAAAPERSVKPCVRPP